MNDEPQFYYSPSTRGFYHDDIHRSRPADCIPLSLSEYQSLIEGHLPGKNVILPGVDGRPMLAPAPVVAPPPDPIALLTKRIEELEAKLVG